MDYADKISSFVSNFDEQQNDFLTVQSLKQQVGEAMERKGEQNVDRAGVQLPLAQAGQALVKKVFGSGVKKAATTTTDEASTDVGASADQVAAAATPGATDTVVTSATAKVAAAAGEEEVVGEAVGLISLETIGTAIPILGAIAGIFVGIRDLIKGHHEEQNTNQTFQMPKGNIDVPTYNPGVS